MNDSVALVVPTRNRAGYLPELFSSLQRQDLKPTLVMVVDSSDEGHARDAARAAVEDAALPCEYLHTRTASAPAQRNIGVKAVRRVLETSYIAFADDDVRLAPDYLRRLVTVLEGDTVGAVMGASGVSQGEITPLPLHWRVYRRVFGLAGGKAGGLMPSGINIPVPPETEAPVLTDWLFGCSMWRTRVFDTFAFRDDMPGAALYDDVEFSARVSRSHALVVDPRARLVHLLAEEERPDVRLHHHRWMRNRHAVVEAVFATRRASAAYWWASFGFGLLAGLRAATGSAEQRERFVGLLTGTLGVLRQEPMR
ncbi:glycosyltransferase family 2 protein [Streptomyces sp. NPDC020794]|uniref:glycosyltransferase family 2 protein n=1 Tax=unclassified Streptomyces TaxID=2593676 RepID=UPI0036DFAB38